MADEAIREMLRRRSPRYGATRVAVSFYRRELKEKGEKLPSPRKLMKKAVRIRARYRGCKSCGCWQEADGTPAYRCSLVIHSCVQPIPDGAMCKNCDVWGPRQAHRCHRILPAAEIGVTKCRQCGIVQTVVHVVGWPVRAD